MSGSIFILDSDRLEGDIVVDQQAKRLVGGLHLYRSGGQGRHRFAGVSQLLRVSWMEFGDQEG